MEPEGRATFSLQSLIIYIIVHVMLLKFSSLDKDPDVCGVGVVYCLDVISVFAVNKTFPV